MLAVPHDSSCRALAGILIYHQQSLAERASVMIQRGHREGLIIFIPLKHFILDLNLRENTKAVLGEPRRSALNWANQVQSVSVTQSWAP